MVPERLDARLVPAAALAWACAAWAVAVPVAALGVVALSSVAVAVALLGARRAGTTAVALVLVAAVATSVLSADLVRSRGLLEPLARQGATAVLEGTAAGDAVPVRADPARPWASSPRWVVRVSVQRVSGRGRTSSAHAEVLVIGAAGWDAVRRGDRTTATGRLQPTRPGDRAAALVLALGRPVTSPPRSRWARWGPRLRGGLVSACAPLGADARGLLPGLVVGDSAALPADLDAAMRTTGLTHLTAVSGGNTALVTGAVLAAAAVLGAGRRLRLLLAGAALLGFAALAGGEPSVLRAAVMGTAVLVGSATSRRGGGLPALATAVAALLVVDPWNARAPGFALSVLATGALLVLAPAWTGALAGSLQRRPRARPGRLLRVLAAALAVPAAAQVVCAPVVLLLSPGLPLLAVPANLLAAPAVAPATLLGLAATLLEPVSLPAATLAARLGGLGATWVALVARTGASAPVATAPWPQGPAPALALAAVTVVALVALGRLTRRR